MKLTRKVILMAAALLTGTVSAAEAVKVGMSGRYFPFTFAKQGELQGFEVDIWNEIGSRLDRDVEFVTANFSGLFGLLETGRIDTISNQITMTEARTAKYAFSQPYVYDGAQIVVKAGNDSIQSLEDLKGKKVAVNLGSNYEELLRKSEYAEEMTIVTYDTGLEHDVVLGRADAFVMDRVGSAQLIKESGMPLQLAGDPFDTFQNAMPFLNNESQLALRDQVNEALDAMREDGTLAEISNKWFGTDITSQ